MQIDQDLHGLSNFNIFFALIEIKWTPLAKNFDKCPTIRRNNTSPAVLCTGADNNATFKRVPKEDCKPEKRTLPGSSKSEARSPSRVPFGYSPLQIPPPYSPFPKRRDISSLAQCRVSGTSEPALSGTRAANCNHLKSVRLGQMAGIRRPRYRSIVLPCAEYEHHSLSNWRLADTARRWKMFGHTM